MNKYTIFNRHTTSTIIQYQQRSIISVINNYRIPNDYTLSHRYAIFNDHSISLIIRYPTIMQYQIILQCPIIITYH